MLFKLFLLFTIVPLCELALLIKIGEVVGLSYTIALVIFTGALGAWLARQQGIAVIAEVNTSMSKGVMPTNALVEGLLILVGGALLVTPGVVTDIFGFAMVVPFTRKLIRESVKRYMVSQVRVSVNNGGGIYYTNMEPGFQKPAPHGAVKDDDDDIDV